MASLNPANIVNSLSNSGYLAPPPGDTDELCVDGDDVQGRHSGHARARVRAHYQHGCAPQPAVSLGNHARLIFQYTTTRVVRAHVRLPSIEGLVCIGSIAGNNGGSGTTTPHYGPAKAGKPASATTTTMHD